ncbi:glutamyl-tRNA reductase [Priestia endophytica]|jgi:glutamyl-tRNA reductase|uniref:Glutamyl-tRNA reductase n=2 Tax=Priestia endophytica TaxID=135735 RepID=A0AAX1QAK8_9BACI|nr:glutamyl-tRNA reductase [Priestia endophytica]KAB2495671.1 glutamyl-tRNA reductase [Priestia endophytica]KYG36238.1 glutamyl-tRNA reductase [Priestia endophytica]MBG9815177.1 glutamyl-tRNA reductase [Priestia endophytica]RAS77792.1 glutamyl-tRNA reductase [Priestia endophytica]RAS82401.1 glutamyl-tRNA reductase [Priestia endophytica]
MHIIAIGLNYRTAPVEIREKVSFNDSELSEAMRVLKEQKSVLENVIVSTCNRTEIYAVVDQLHTGRYYVKAFLAEWFNISKEELSPYLTIYEHDAAIEHLYRVVSGLDSMVLGETQILGQVRSSFLTAQGQGATGTVFNQLFKEAVTLAKRAHHYTDIGANAVSVSYAAVELGKKIFGNLSQKHVLILGAGKMGELAAKNLSGSGVGNVTVINRTKEKAEALAQRFEGNARSFEDLAGALLEADIVISSTSATEYVITKETMKEVEKLRKGRPIFMVDIAVPRDLDPSLSELETVFLYDIDDLEGIVEANLQERQKAAETIEIMIEAAVVEFKTWIGTLGVVPVISALRQKALNIQNETMKSIERKLPNLTERERKVLNKHTKSIINQLLKDPILSAKELAGQKDAEQSLQLFMKIFDIEHMVRDERTIEKKVEKTPLAHEIVHPS